MTRVSFEFFPPQTAESLDSLVNKVAVKLNEANPEFFSVTYGAGGSTRKGTLETVSRLFASGSEAVPHLSMGRDDEGAVKDLLEQYKSIGVKRIVALRGDVPSGTGQQVNNNAEMLVRFIRQNFGDHFSLEVAAYPEVHPDAPSAPEDLDFFIRKVEAGADAAITQFFYNPYAYLDFRERLSARGINIPIYVGIMPIASVEGLMRISSKAAADLPRWMVKKMETIKEDDRAVREFGVEVCTRLCEDLIAQGAPGFHFYTLNRWGATTRILSNLSL